MDQLTTEDHSLIETINIDNTVSSSLSSTEQMETVELDTPNEQQLRRQIEELTKQLNESMKKYFYYSTKIFFR
jgi:hypothetical protein